MRLWWEDEGVRFECRGCGRCCGGEPGEIWVTPAERAKIAAELGMDEITLRKECLRRVDGRLGIKEKENYDCYFLDGGTKRCKIYKVRPLQCRMFPFWPSMLSDKRVWITTPPSAPAWAKENSIRPNLFGSSSSFRLRKIYKAVYPAYAGRIFYALNPRGLRRSKL